MSKDREVTILINEENLKALESTEGGVPAQAVYLIPRDKKRHVLILDVPIGLNPFPVRLAASTDRTLAGAYETAKGKRT